MFLFHVDKHQVVAGIIRELALKSKQFLCVTHPQPLLLFAISRLNGVGLRDTWELSKSAKMRYKALGALTTSHPTAHTYFPDTLLSCVVYIYTLFFHFLETSLSASQ